MDSLHGALPGLVPRDYSAASNSSLSSGPPAVRSALANHSTLLVSWWCTICALVIILVRLWGRYERTRKFFTEDKLMALSIIPLLTRMAFAHPILLWGTNNIDTVSVVLTATQIRNHSMGARLVLPARIFYALFIWTAKFTVSEYLKRLVSSIWTERYQFVLRCIRIFLVLTFCAVVVATLAECTPFSHYWQVVPDPGPQCRNGFAQLLTMGTCDMITDILLIAFPIHLLWKSTMPTTRKLSLSVLFSLSLILIAITAYRIVAIVDSRGLQQLRTLWASLEILAAAAVSNALVLGSFLRDRGVKKVKYRGSPRSRAASTAAAEPSINRSMTQQHWGNDSDEDLFKSVRGRLGSVADTVSINSRAPPLASPRFAPPGSDTESNIHEENEEETEAEHGEAVWMGRSSKEKYVGSQESSVATSWSSDAKVGPPDRAQTISHDFASWSNGFASMQTRELSAFLRETPPPSSAATLPLQQPDLGGNNQLARVGSASSNTQHAFHTPLRTSRFAASPSPTQPEIMPLSSGALPPIVRTDTTPSSTPTLQDAGGLLGVAHVSPVGQLAPPGRPTIAANPEETEPEDARKHSFRGFRAWRRPSRRESNQMTPLPPAASRPAQQQRLDPMDLQDPGGLLGP